MNAGTHKRDPFLNLLPLFWEKKHKRNTWNKASDLSTPFRGKQAHDPKTKWFSDGSKRFRYFSIYDAKKHKQIQRFRFA